MLLAISYRTNHCHLKKYMVGILELSWQVALVLVMWMPKLQQMQV